MVEFERMQVKNINIGAYFAGGRLLEEILSNHEQENRERRRLSDVTPSRTYSSAR